MRNPNRVMRTRTEKMSLAEKPNLAARDEAELQFLRALSQPHLPPVLRLAYCQKVRAHHFSDMANGTLFEEICAMTKPDHLQTARALREDLPVRATRRGFPDLDFSALLARDATSTQAATTQLQHAYQNLLQHALTR